MFSTILQRNSAGRSVSFARAERSASSFRCLSGIVGALLAAAVEVPVVSLCAETIFRYDEGRDERGCRRRLGGFVPLDYFNLTTR